MHSLLVVDFLFSDDQSRFQHHVKINKMLIFIKLIVLASSNFKCFASCLYIVVHKIHFVDFFFFVFNVAELCLQEVNADRRVHFATINNSPTHSLLMIPALEITPLPLC